MVVTDLSGPVPSPHFTTSPESGHQVMTLSIAAAVLAATVLAAGSALAQPTSKLEQLNQENTKVHHAGGRHDQMLHEAAERARANGHRMQQATVHAGGRHDIRAHEAAMKAEVGRSAGERTAVEPSR